MVATTSPPNDPANKNEIMNSRNKSNDASANLLCSNFALMTRKLKATAMPIAK